MRTKILIALFPLIFVPSKAVSNPPVVPSKATPLPHQPVCNPQKASLTQATAEFDTVKERYNSVVSNHKDSLNNLPADSLFKVTKFQNQDSFNRQIHFKGTRAELIFIARTQQLDQAFKNLTQAEDKKTKARENYHRCLNFAEQQPADASP